MKKILIACIILMSTMHLYGQKRITVTRSAAYPEHLRDSLNKIANDFSGCVGNILKEEFPVTIDSSSLVVNMKCENDSIFLSYSVELVECDSSKALYYFDRRGALTKDIRPYVAGIDAEDRCAQQALVVSRTFKKSYGTIIFQRYVDVDIQCKGYTYALSEFFLASPR